MVCQTRISRPSEFTIGSSPLHVLFWRRTGRIVER